MRPVVVLSAHTMGYAVIRALAKKGVPVIAVYYDDQDIGYVSKYVDEKIKSPHPEEYEEEFLELLKDLGKKFMGGLLVPANDETLQAVAKHKSLLSKYFKVAFNDLSIIEKLINKKYTYQLAESVGIPFPLTLFPESEDEVAEFNIKVEYPVIMKPIISHQFYSKFMQKIFIAKNLSELLKYYNLAKDSKAEVMIQELIPGTDNNMVMYNSYYNQGTPILELTAEKVRNGPPIYGNSRVSITKHIPEIIQPARKYLSALGYDGYSCTEFKKDDRDGIYKFMETNGRYNLSTYLLIGASLNIPWMEYKRLMMDEEPKHIEFKEGIYWIDIIRDLSYTLTNFTREPYKIREYFKPYFRPHVFAILDWKDPLPFIKRISSLFSDIKHLKSKVKAYS